MGIFIGELIGTFIFIFFTLAIVSNAILMSKNNAISLLITSVGVALAYMMPCMIFGDLTGAHFNPAVTVATMFMHLIDTTYLPYYISAQLIGSFAASTVFMLGFRHNVKKIKDEESKLKVFVVVPSSNNNVINFLKEMFASYIFMFLLLIVTFVIKGTSQGTINIFVFLLTMLIGLAFNYTTVTLNPLRDLFMRLLYIPKDLKSKSNMSYVFVTLLAPIIGTILAAITYRLIPWDKMI